MSVDLEALVRQLEADPSHRAALRRVLFGDGPDVTASLDRLVGVIADLATEVSNLAVRQQATEESLRELAIRQQATKDSLQKRADTVRGLADRVSKHDG